MALPHADLRDPVSFPAPFPTRTPFLCRIPCFTDPKPWIVTAGHLFSLLVHMLISHAESQSSCPSGSSGGRPSPEDSPTEGVQVTKREETSSEVASSGLEVPDGHRCLFQPTVIVPHAHWEYMKYNPRIHLGLQSSHRCLFQPTVFVTPAHWQAYGVAVSHCISWFQTQLILTTRQIRYHAIAGSS